MEPREFFFIAKDLLRTPKPSYCRTAINRSYYAAYNVAVGLLERSGVMVRKSGVGHGEVAKYLRNCGLIDIEDAQTKLTNLAGQRIKADYRLNDNFAEKAKNAEKAVRTAESILKTFDLYSSNSDTKTIAKGISKYKNLIKSAAKNSSES